MTVALGGFTFTDAGQLYVTTDAPDSATTFANGYAFAGDGALHVVSGTPAAGEPYLAGVARTHAGACYITTSAPSTPRYNGKFVLTDLGQIFVENEGTISHFQNGMPVTSAGALVVSESTDVAEDFLLLETGFPDHVLQEDGVSLIELE